MRVHFTFDTDLNKADVDLLKMVSMVVGKYAGSNLSEPAKTEVTQEEVTEAKTKITATQTKITAYQPDVRGHESEEFIKEHIAPVVDPGHGATVTRPEPVATALIETDKNGVPFDPEIHSSAKKFNKDGSWKARRGVAKAAPAPTPAPAPAPQPAAPSTQVSFPMLMNAVKESGLTEEQVDALAVKHGLDNIYEAAINPEVISAILGDLGV